jgi:hypothetical protein
MKDLRSGESLTRQWRSFNELVRGTNFRARQVYNTQAAFAARPPRQLRTPLGAGWNYRGYFDPAIGTAAGYNLYDVVQYGSGVSQGMYFSTISGNNNAPDSGIGWVQISTASGVAI